MSRRLGALAAVLCALLIPSLATAPAHAATPPSGMFGIGDWAWPSTATLDREAAHGLRTWRVSLSYAAVGGTKGTLNFSGVDTLVADMASRGVTPLFLLAGCPAWQCPLGGAPTSGQALIDWRAYVTAAVKRYGTGGTFWAAHPTVPKRPVTYWQVWNEVNGSDQWPNPSAAAYAAFLASTSSAIRAADSQAKVVLSGLPQKMTIWLKDYLPALYAQPGFKSSFDIMAVHGYATMADEVAAILDVARRIMIANDDTAKPVWITEMGWATGGPPHPFVTTEDYQAAKLRKSWDLVLGCRARWNLGRVYWFGWQDKAVPAGGTDYWGYHKGFYRLDGTAKPAMAAADEYTSGLPLPSGRGGTCRLPGGDAIDMVTPDTSVPAGPAPRVADTMPPFTLAATESPVRFECRFEGAAWTTCTPAADGTWRPATALAQGTHTLSVRAIDPTGNTDATPATRTFTVDLSPPDTHVSGTWGNLTSPVVPALSLSATEATQRYECRVDALAWATCASPYSTTLATGHHTISVRAVDLAGNADPSPSVPWYQVA